MDKVHQVEQVRFEGTMLLLRVDGRQYRIDIATQSERLARALPQQRDNFEVSPCGYGIHWPELDEDLSIDGLIGAKHVRPALAETAG